jgi:hypothetical protein
MIFVDAAFDEEEAILLWSLAMILVVNNYLST